ncbi:Tn3 family transposase [Streptomyces sp. NPDC006385]|uniref:Tn3 family transposase n=1 Tax=Streptomyces sp. NPDC006385 TaxID=3156761 RepID=UPI0033AF0EC5
MSAAGSSASRTSCACSWRCGTRCGGGRSGCRARTGGRTPRTPQDPEKFIEALQNRLREALTRFDTALELGTTGGVDIVKRHGEPWIKVSPLGKQEEPENLVALKTEIERRWGTIDLIDILKEAEFATGFTGEFTSVATREAVPKAVLRRRLLLVLFALETNMGIKRVAVTGKHGESEAVLRRVRHLLSTGPTCARRWCGWSTPPSPPAIRRGGARAPPARATPRSSAPVIRGGRRPSATQHE